MHGTTNLPISWHMLHWHKPQHRPFAGYITPSQTQWYGQWSLQIGFALGSGLVCIKALNDLASIHCLWATFGLPNPFLTHFYQHWLSGFLKILWSKPPLSRLLCAEADRDQNSLRPVIKINRAPRQAIHLPDEVPVEHSAAYILRQRKYDVSSPSKTHKRIQPIHLYQDLWENDVATHFIFYGTPCHQIWKTLRGVLSAVE